MKIFLITVLFFHSHLNSQDSGYQMYKDGDINSALQYYNTLLEMENEDISKESLLYNIGTIYSSMDDIPEANSVFQKAYNDSFGRFEAGVLNSFDFVQIKQRYETAVSDLVRAKFDYIFKLKVLEFYFGIPIEI